MVTSKHCFCCHLHASPPGDCTCKGERELRQRLRRRRAARRPVAQACHRVVPTPAEQRNPLRVAVEQAVDLLKAALQREPGAGSDERSPYTADELRRLFSTADYMDWVDGRPHRFWGPILGLCMGLRATEIARLRVDDLVLAYGHWCLAIASPRRRTDTSRGGSGVRLVPIPPAVMAAGFLSFVGHARTTQSEHLFPSLMASRAGCADPSLGGQRLAGQFALYTMLFEFTPRRVFKALRTTLAVRLAEQGMDISAIEQLMGRSSKHASQANVPLARALLVDQAAHALAAVRWPMVLPCCQETFPRR